MRGSSRVGHNATIVQFYAPLCARCHLRIVRSDDDGMSTLRQISKKGKKLFAQRGVERTGWFVGQYDPPAVHNRPSDGYALLFATGQLRR